MRTKKVLHKAVIAISIVVLLFSSFLFYAFSLMMPSKAVEREAIVGVGENIVSINGFDLWYRLYNENFNGIPIIVAAGGCGLSSEYMEQAMKSLSDLHPVLFFDPRGSGRSQIKADLSNYSIEIFANEIDNVRKSFFSDKEVIIIAHSFGGIVAMQYAVEYQDNLEKLILISPVDAQYTPRMTSGYIKAGLPPKNQFEANDWYVRNIDAFFGLYFENPSHISIFDNTSATFAVMQSVGSVKQDLSACLSNVEVPVLIMVGGESEYPLTPFEVSEKIATLFPNAQLEQFQNSGHFLFVEENEHFIATMNAFINEE